MQIIALESIVVVFRSPLLTVLCMRWTMRLSVQHRTLLPKPTDGQLVMLDTSLGLKILNIQATHYLNLQIH